jgi:hypothetical protein
MSPQLAACLFILLILYLFISDGYLETYLNLGLIGLLLLVGTLVSGYVGSSDRESDGFAHTVPLSPMNRQRS